MSLNDFIKELQECTDPKDLDIEYPDLAKKIETATYRCKYHTDDLIIFIKTYLRIRRPDEGFEVALKKDEYNWSVVVLKKRAVKSNLVVLL